MTRSTLLVSSLMALAIAIPACATSDDDAGNGAGAGGGKADDATSPLRGAWGHFIYEGGSIVKSATLLFTYDVDQEHLRLRIGAFDHQAGTEGYLVHEPFTLDAGFAEVKFAPDCTLYLAHEGRAIEVMQAGPCAGSVPATMTLDGTYLIDRGVARIDTYRQQTAAQTGNMTLITSGLRMEFAIGVSAAGAATTITGVVNRPPASSTATYDAGPDCKLTFTYTGTESDTDVVRLDQVGTCAAQTNGGGPRFAGEWHRFD